MIERLELKRWRAFDEIGLDFNPGTTFLVAPNGVGKTSLLLGLTWALFGDNSKVHAASCVRLGADDAEAAVTIRLRDDARLVIHRRVTTAGKTTPTFTHSGSGVDTRRGEELLREEFGASLDVAARLAVIRGSGWEQGELDLHEHLYDTFGVTDLRQAAARATQLAKAAVAARKKVRSATRAQLANRDQLVTAADQLERDVAQLETQRAALAQRLAAAAGALQLRDEWQGYEQAARQQHEAISSLLTEAGAARIEASDLSSLLEGVGSAAARIEAALAGSRDELVRAQAQEFAAQSALGLLDGHDPECPTCARPFHGEELQRSLDAQRTSLEHARTHAERAKAAIGTAEIESRRLQDLRTQATRLSDPVLPPTTARPEGNPDELRVEAERALREHDERAGSVARERAVIVEQLAADDDARAADATERTAWRREALMQAAAAALTETANRTATEHIEPLSRQVRWRWKALFGEDGLQLRPDGSIVRVVNDRELRWEYLSSGEQIWARLVANLLILQASTTVPFAWLDEPLEHLDPRARRIVATDLATATRSGRPAQLIVTTYEHAIAKQLAEDVSEASIRLIDRTPEYVARLRDAS